MSVLGKVGRLFGGAVAESLAVQLRAKHLECEALKEIIRTSPAFGLDAMTSHDVATWITRARAAVSKRGAVP